MEWATTNFTDNEFDFLNVQDGEILAVNNDCLAILEEILEKLSSENDRKLYTFRRTLGSRQIIARSLIPLLLYVKGEAKRPEYTKIINTTIKILVNLTLPVEYLLSKETMSHTDVGKHVIFELNQLLTINKEAFTDDRSTKLVVDHMKDILENHTELNFEQCDSINNCLLLLRNVLHTPESKTNISSCSINHLSKQNLVIWNLFSHGLNKVIIYLISCPQKIFWSVTIVQLIALLYKDQHVGTLQKLLNVWLEASYSDSSDDESNTSPPDADCDDISSRISSNISSDLSDNGRGNNMNKLKNKINCVKAIHSVENQCNTQNFIKGNNYTRTETRNNKSDLSSDKIISVNENQSQMLDQTMPGKNMSFSCLFSPSEISDYGYVTQIENQETLSSSSNDDDHKLVRQTSHTYQKGRYCNRKFRVSKKKDLRRKKLGPRNTTKRMGGLVVKHLPTDKDIENVLKEFTVDFLLKGYGTLVNDLHIQLLTNIHIDTSHFFWLITYFLKFAIQMELDPEYLGPVLSFEILSYFTFQAVYMQEELESRYAIPGNDLKHCVRRLHLVLIAIKEFFQGLESYQKMIHLNDNDLNKFFILQAQIRKTKEFKMLFVYLLSYYNQNIQSKEYLKDLILTNHIFLVFLENGTGTEDKHCNMVDYLTQYATVEIMRQYGILLENFGENGKIVNNCIFTMMHHVCGDHKNIPKLFQPSILNTFLQIWEADYEICDDWSDLIEYIIHEFINTPTTNRTNTISTNLTDYIPYFEKTDQLASLKNNNKYECSKKQDIIQKYYIKCRQSFGTTAKTEKHERREMERKTERSVMTELIKQNIISVEDYNEITINNKGINEEPFNDNFNPTFEEMSIKDNLVKDDIKLLRDYLLNENQSRLIIWLQNILTEVYYVKMVLSNPAKFKDNIKTLEPTVYHCALLNLPIPLIPWTVDYQNILEYQPFLLLLHKLGFHLPKDIGKLFARIPNFWSTDYILSIAQKLGPIDAAKFDISNLRRRKKFHQFGVRAQSSTLVVYKPGTSLKQFPHNLLIQIPKSKEVSSQLTIANKTGSNKQESPANMDSSPIHEPHLMSIDSLEKNKDCETASLTFELLNMYVSDISDEEDMTLVIEKKYLF